MGLLKNTSEAELCMDEARNGMCSPRQLRFLFTILVTEGAPATRLFSKHRDFMELDFKLNRAIPSHIAQNEMLKDLVRRLESYSRCLSDFKLPEPNDDETEVQKEKARHNVDQNRTQSLQAISYLNNEQSKIFNELVNAVQKNYSCPVYVNGGPGRGKTFLLSTLAAHLRSTGKIVLCCASTGFVAVMYAGGRTAHNLFKIPVPEDEFDLAKIECDIPYNSQRATLLRAAALIIFDEITMTSRQNLEAIDEILRRVRDRPNDPFGGLVFVGAGDFRQILPIIKNGTRNDTVEATIKYSPLWVKFTVLNLTIPVRQLTDPVFSTFVDSIADGTAEQTAEGKVCLRLIKATTSTVEWLNFLYPEIHKGIAETNNRALLSVLNKDVDSFNATITDQLPSQYVTLYSDDQLNESPEVSEFFKNNVTTEFFNQRNFPNTPPHELNLKKACKLSSCGICLRMKGF